MIKKILPMKKTRVLSIGNMSCLMLLIFLLGGTGFAVEDVKGIELLSNTGFEQGADTQGNVGIVPKHWARSWSKKGTVALVKDKGQAHSGETCVKIENNYISQNIRVICGYEYSCSIWIKGTGSARIFFYQYAKEKGVEKCNKVIGYKRPDVKITDQWKRMSASYCLEDPRVTKVSFVVKVKGKALVDDASVTQVGGEAILFVRSPSIPEDIKFPSSAKPLLPLPDKWNFNDYWKQRKIGNKDYYQSEKGPYLRMSEKSLEKLRQTGFINQTISGFVGFNYGLDNFAPETMEKLPPNIQELCRNYLKNKWPIFSIQYCSAKGRPSPSKEAIEAVGDLWIGDGQPEEAIYRLEPVFHYLRTGKMWKGSSSGWAEKEAMKRFFREKLCPRLEKEMPFYRDQDHKWTRAELRKLSDIYTDEWSKPIYGRLVSWGMFLSSYYIVAMPENVTVAEKGMDALSNAYARGRMRQSGGNKFYFTWQSNAKFVHYDYPLSSGTTIIRKEGGEAVNVWYHLYRPYLIGANYAVNEGIPPYIIDIEGDGQYELPVTGHIIKDIVDFAERHPERGVAYAPVALILDYNRDFSRSRLGRGSFLGYNMPYDDADQMNNQIIHNLLFPQHPQKRKYADYGPLRVAPYGEIFDILSPNMPGRAVDEKALENYKVLFAFGGLNIDQDFAEKIMTHVKKGGTLVINAEDAGKYLPADFLGVEILPDTFEARKTVCAVCGKTYTESPFTCRKMKLKPGAEAIMTTGDGSPVISRNRYGKGTVIVIGAHYMIQNRAVKSVERGGKSWQKKTLLKMVPHFFDHLLSGLMPIEVIRREKDRENISWIVSKKGDGWLVTMFNYSLARESLPQVARGPDDADFVDEYPYREVPFQIVARVPVKDVMELHGDRDVNWQLKDGKAVISETMHGDEIRVYELQPHKIGMKPRTRYVNYALNKPVTASSTLKKLLGYKPHRAVDGDLDNTRFWWSGVKKSRFKMPQWLQVDLGEAKTIDHVFVLFHCWPRESLDSRLRIYQYIVEASLDGKKWQTVLDESKSVKNVRREGLERWFDPVKARYVRLTVNWNSSRAGAQVVEMKVMGPEKESYKPSRVRLSQEK